MANPLPVSGDLLRRYLAILGVARREPSLGALRELVAAHLTRIPFENISKLYYWKRFGLVELPSLQRYLDGIEHYHFGGTCYSNNYYLNRLMVSLGYRAKLCGADMAQPDVHMVSLVQVDGWEYLVDAGYAAPFLEPLPRELSSDHVVSLGRDCYRLKPQDAEGCSRLELFRDDVLKHGYLAKPRPRAIEDFQEVITGSFRANATFLNCVLLARFYPARSVVIHNLSLIISKGPQSTQSSLPHRQALVERVEEHFGIPPEIVSVALEGLEKLEDAWA